MKKVLVVLLAVLLMLGVVSASAANSGVTLARSMGYTPEISELDDLVYRCDYRVANTLRAVITWSDSENVYTVHGPWPDMAKLYLQLLDSEDWLSCRYTLGNRPRHTYNALAKHIYTPLDAYRDQMAEELAPVLEAASAPTPTPTAAVEDEAQDYVVNTRSMVFHYPHCPSVDEMSKKNRSDRHCTREDLIRAHYKSCDRCNP